MKFIIYLGLGTSQTLDYVNDFEAGINPIAYFPSCNLVSSNSDVFMRLKELNKWLFSNESCRV